MENCFYLSFVELGKVVHDHRAVINVTYGCANIKFLNFEIATKKWMNWNKFWL